MKKILLVLVLLFFSTTTVLAYGLFLTDVKTPYQVVPLEKSLTEDQLYLGELKDFPVMYEVEVAQPQTLFLQLSQLSEGKPEPLPLRIIVVKVDDSGRGVTEVSRFNPSADGWTKNRNKSIGLTFWDSKRIESELDNGVYRIEISTADNIGKYILRIGDMTENLSYFSTLARAREIHKFYDYSIFRMIVLPSVYYPLGIILLLLVINRTRKYSKNIKNDS